VPEHTAATSVAPPNAPWRAIEADPSAGAYVSVYLSSTLGRLPVRDILRLGDNKADPNLETKTYGLFSTCEPIMRTSVAQRNIGDVFFITSVDGIGRALVGWYELGWIAELGAKDFALTARYMRFIDPIPLRRMSPRLRAEIPENLRNYKRVEPAIADELRKLVAASPDRTNDYLAEVDRLERLSYSRTGFRYPSWDRAGSFTWAEAPSFMAESPQATPAPNTSPTGTWVCTGCGAEIRNEARLKVCNSCGSRDTLQPGASV
jgi:hypothetical protein